VVKRTIWGLVLGVAFLFAILQSLPVVLALVLVVHIVAQYEFYAVIPGLSGRGKWGHIVLSSLLWLGCALALAGIGPPLLIPVYVSLALISYAVVLVLRQEQGKDTHAHIRLLRTLIFITLPLSFLPALLTWPGAMPVALLLFGVSWGADSGAIWAGKLCGRTPLAPHLSPRKTLEGAVGGVLAGGFTWVGCGLLYHGPGILDPVAAALHPAVYAMCLMVCGIALATVGIFGDLAFSLFKRMADVKDYGKVIPGHGGVLDRFDSMLFTAPLLYLLCLLLQYFPANLR
jgi:phosphatidate cytidylyltransferase